MIINSLNTFKNVDEKHELLMLSKIRKFVLSFISAEFLHDHIMFIADAYEHEHIVNISNQNLKLEMRFIKNIVA